MGSGGLRREGLEHLDRVMEGHALAGVPGLTWLVARHGEVHAGAAGVHDRVQGGAVERDAIFRIASMTKPILAVATLQLVEECTLRLDDPIDVWLPELADRRVMVDPTGSLDDTVPAERAITLDDLLTFRLGLGMDFDFGRPQPLLDAANALGVGVGPPAVGAPEPDEYLRRLGTLPLAHQPGARWLYHLGSEVLGVLVARATGQPLDEVLRERVLEPLGMRDTGFFVPEADRHRFGTADGVDFETDEPIAYDTVDGMWSSRPAFPSGGGGLVSTVDDFLAFSELLLGRGEARGRRLLSRASVEAMTTDHLTDEQRQRARLDAQDAEGWGYGLAVRVRRTGPTGSVGTYGWAGGLGTSWANDPAEGLIGIVLTNDMFTSNIAPPVVRDFWTCAYAAIDG